MRWAVVACLIVCAGCSGRPLAEGERALADDLFGPNFNADKVRVVEIPTGKTERQKEPPQALATIEPRPGVCDRIEPRPGPPGPPAAFVLYQQINVQPDFYRADMVAGWPGQILIPEVLLAAHELVHVWQWQNRRLTGYRPARAGLESILNRDPYFYVPEPGAGFLEYGFEQQAALLEDYLCYLIFDPTAPRRAEIRAILAPYFTLDRLDAVMQR
ncbi:MAG: hypothetical protein AAF748_09290 [Pseudomonadota bacterium]